jgi:hypothetical protein
MSCYDHVSSPRDAPQYALLPLLRPQNQVQDSVVIFPSRIFIFGRSCAQVAAAYLVLGRQCNPQSQLMTDAQLLSVMHVASALPQRVLLASVRG